MKPLFAFCLITLAICSPFERKSQLGKKIITWSKEIGHVFRLSATFVHFFRKVENGGSFFIFFSFFRPDLKVSYIWREPEITIKITISKAVWPCEYILRSDTTPCWHPNKCIHPPPFPIIHFLSGILEPMIHARNWFAFGVIRRTVMPRLRILM